MIEIIYDKDKENNSIDAEYESKDKLKDNTLGVKLPKNIRQVGTPSGNKRIYIEDYVVTYLNYISRPGSTHARGAVLLGEVKKMEIGDVVFVSGAVDAQNIEFDMDESTFTQEAWSNIYDQVKEFFPDLSVVGWFLSRMGFSTAINDKIEKMHVENFPGKDKVLYIIDSLENEDAFYMYEKGQLVKQRGYIIYYAKNECMQNYIVKQKNGLADELDSEIKRKDEELIKNYRDKNNRTQGTKTGGMNLIYIASSFAVLVLLAMGITIVSNYDKMKDMEISINRLELTAEQDTQSIETKEVIAANSNTTDAAQYENSEVQNENIVDDVNATTQKDTSTESIDNNLQDDGLDGSVDEISTEQSLPVITNGNPTYYTVKLGDTLTSIALATYGATTYAEDIANANNMGVDDRIYEGQQIILPSVTPR